MEPITGQRGLEMLETKGSENITDTKFHTRHDFSEDYRRGLFNQWYLANQPSCDELFSNLTKEARYDQFSGRTLTKVTLSRMIQNFRTEGFMEDQETLSQLRSSIANTRAEMMKRQLKELKEIQELALTRIKKADMTAGVAVTAYFKALREEQLGRGIDLEEYDRINNLSEEQVITLLRELGEKNLFDNTDTEKQIATTGTAK